MRPLIALVATLLFASGARAQLIDRVVAFVDDDVILLSELRQHAAPQLASGEDPLSVHRQVLDQRIEAILVHREAKRLGIEVTEEELRRALSDLRSRNGLDESAFRRALAEQGWEPALYEQVLADQLLRLKLLQRLTIALPAIEDHAVRAEWERRAASFEGERRYRIANLSELIAGDRDGARTRLEERLARLRAGAEPSEVGALEAGWVLASELTAEIGAVLEALEVGQASAIRETDTAFVAIQLLEVAETEPPPFESQRDTLRHELYEAQVNQVEQSLLTELRASASIVRRL